MNVYYEVQPVRRDDKGSLERCSMEDANQFGIYRVELHDKEARACTWVADRNEAWEADVLCKNLNDPKGDPDNQNDDRAAWAAAALQAFVQVTGTEGPDAMADLLCDLMHLCDRAPYNFAAELQRAYGNYIAETARPE